MDNPRPEKVAIVDEVRERLASSDGALLTEYRGLTVAELAALRRELAAAGGDYKVYKNTLVRLAVAGTDQAGLHDLLTGPTAIAFVHGDVSAVAKALRDFARTTPALVVKGGVVGSGVLSAGEVGRLADLPSRETLLAQFAGALQAPMQQLAGLLQALPRNLAYGLSALVEARQAGGEALPATETAETAEPAPAEDAAAPVETAEAAADEPVAAADEPAAAAEPAATDEASAADEAPAEPAAADEAPAE